MYSNRKINYVFDGLDLPPLLSEEDTIKYLYLAKNGDLNARNILIVHNIRIITTLIHTYFGYDNNATVSDEDLVSEGVFAIVRAIENFDFEIGITFRSYLKPCIRHVIKNQLSRVKSYDMSLEATLDNNNEDDDFSLLRALDTGQNVENDYIEQVTGSDIEASLFILNELEKNIIILFYGLFNQQSFKTREIAEMLNTHQSTVSKNLIMARIKLRSFLSRRLFYKIPIKDKQKQLVG